MLTDMLKVGGYKECLIEQEKSGRYSHRSFSSRGGVLFWDLDEADVWGVGRKAPEYGSVTVFFTAPHTTYRI